MDDIKKKLGLIHVYTGNGKGKTTAALGLALRAMEHGLSVGLLQFLKGGAYIGELLSTKRFPGKLVVEQFGKGSTGEPTFEDFSPDDADRDRALVGLARAKELMLAGETDVLILDEINVAVHLEHLTVKEVLLLMEEKPENMELVLTGRNAPKEIMDAADYVTDMRAWKHPFNKGVLGRKGIDY